MLLNNFVECYAIPGENSIIDGINPDTGLTCINGNTEAEMREREPRAVRIAWEAWRRQQIERQQTPIRWALTTERNYQRMLEVLPPAYWDGGAFLVGEPFDHCMETGRPRFEAYVSRAGRYYVASRPLTISELKAELGR